MDSHSASLDNKQDKSVVKKRGFSTDFRDHEGLLHKFARAAWGRLTSAGVHEEYEDIYQEMCVSFTKALRTYNPDSGIAFSSYMGQAVKNNFNKLADKHINRRVSVVYLEDMGRNHCEDSYEDGGWGNFDFDIQMCEAVSPGMRLRLAKEKIEELSNAARLVIRELISPSQALRQQHFAMLEHARMARELGERVPRIPQEIDLSFIFKHSNLDTRTVKRVKREFQTVLGVEV